MKSGLRPGPDGLEERRSRRSATDRAEKAGTVTHDNSDEARMERAEQLAEQNLQAAAEAFSAIACDQEVADEVRLSAAEQLADLDPRAVAPAGTAIAGDGAVADEVRLSAAELLATVDPRR
jgi:hypothetical protein